MKNTKQALSTILLGLAIFTTSAFACGEMSNGSKCLIDSPTDGPVITKVDKGTAFDLDIEIGAFFRDVFSKIFG